MKSAIEFFNLFLVSTHFYILAKMAMAMLLGGIIGFERELKRKPVGVKTCVIIAVTTCVLTIVSIQAAEHYAQVSENIRTDPMRLAAQVISGIGFLGAGVILRKSNDAISGLTTAAIIWAAAGIGIASGAGFFFDAIIATMMILVAVRLSPIVQSLVRRKNNIRKTKITIQLNTPNAIGKITDILISNNYRVDSLNVKDLPNTDDVRLNVRCLITDKMMLQNLYLLLKNEPEVVSVDLEG